MPEGYLNVLTKEQWVGGLDFVKAIGAKLMISVANCPGLHSANEPWNPSEAEKIFSLSKEYSVPINAAEFANEPNMMEDTGSPKGYTPADYRRDQDLFFSWGRKNYPDCLCIGPCTTGGDNVSLGKDSADQKLGGIEQLAANTCNCADLMEGTKEPMDAFSYHYYNGVSKRLASVMPSGHWDAADAVTEPYLAMAFNFARSYAPIREKYCPGGKMWVTESGDAGGTDNHLMFLDLRDTGVTGKELEKDLDAVYITTNKNAIPNDPQKPTVTSGVQLGTPAVITCGFREDDMDVVADCIYKVVIDFEGQQGAVRETVKGFCAKCSLYE